MRRESFQIPFVKHVPFEGVREIWSEFRFTLKHRNHYAWRHVWLTLLDITSLPMVLVMVLLFDLALLTAPCKCPRCRLPQCSRMLCCKCTRDLAQRRRHNPNLPYSDVYDH